jgi:hypothetical protein
MLGPIVGAALNDAVGLTLTFIIFSSILTVVGILAFFFIPKALNQKFSDSPETINHRMSVAHSVEKIEKVSYSWFLLNRRAIFAFISVTFMTILC